jgi:hypothetical protein
MNAMTISRGVVVTVAFCLSAAAQTQVSGPRDKLVRTVAQKVAGLPSVDVQDTEKFLNDLKLSPYWKVEKNRAGEFVAFARSIGSETAFSKVDGRFLFEQSWEPAAALAVDWRIKNHGMGAGEEVVALDASIVFKKPEDAKIGYVAADGSVSLGIYQWIFPGGGEQLDGNSSSELALKISKEHPVYLLIREQGQSGTRATTFAKALALAREAAAAAALPAKYHVRDQYAPFFKKLFPESAKDVALKRLAGLQDRDTFYGYFRTKKGTSYEGVNLRVSHPVFSNGEATRDFERLRKAEYLGKPYVEDDWLFFLIEDNAVYLLPQYDKDYGTFSGKGSFQGKVELLNVDNQVLYESEEAFKGWER